MLGVGVTIAVAVVAFVGTMVDNFVAYASQLALTELDRRRRAHRGQFVGFFGVLVGSAVVAASLADIPLRWIGILSLVPLALAVNRWRHGRRAPRAARRGSIATFLLTVAYGGDNFVVWIPLLRASGWRQSAVVAAVFVLADVALLAAGSAVASRASLLALTERRGPAVIPYLYVGLAVLVAWECRWF